MIIDGLMFEVNENAIKPMSLDKLEQFVKPKNYEISISTVTPDYCNNIMKEILG